MTGIGTRPPAVVAPRLAGTDYGQTVTDGGNVPDHVRKDLDLNKNAIREWNRLRRGIKGDVKSADPATESQPRLRLAMAHRQNLAGFRRTIQATAERVGHGFATRKILLSGNTPLEHQDDARAEVERELPHLRKKLSLLCQFDRLAAQMRGRSGADKVATTLSGLDQQAFDKVNVNLKDDIFLAKQNKLLSVSKWRPADGFGRVKSSRSRELIRRAVAATLLQHGYAAAKLVKQDLTKYCELSERSGTDTAFADHVREKVARALDRINGGEPAADVHADVFCEINGKTEQENLQAISKNEFAHLLDLPQDSQLDDDQERQVRDALLMTAAKGTLKAAQQFKDELIGKDPNQQAALAAAKVQDLDQTKAHEPHIFYNPFRRKDAFGPDYNLERGRQKYAAKPHYTIKASSYWGKALKNVNDNHVVLVSGHGLDRHPKIQSITTRPPNITKRQRAAAVLTAERLAERLEKDGLPKTHKFIRMHSCYGGGSAISGVQLPAEDGRERFDYTEAIRKNDREGGAFAQLLAIALHARGYANIVVGGYPGAVSSGNVGERKLVEVVAGGTRLVPADSLCLYYDGRGQRVPNPRNPDKRLSEQQVNNLLNNRLQ